MVLGTADGSLLVEVNGLLLGSEDISAPIGSLLGFLTDYSLGYSLSSTLGYSLVF